MGFNSAFKGLMLSLILPPRGLCRPRQQHHAPPTSYDPCETFKIFTLCWVNIQTYSYIHKKPKASNIAEDIAMAKTMEIQSRNITRLVVCFLLGNSPASEFYMPTFRNTLYRLRRCLPAYEDGTDRVFPKRRYIKFRPRGIIQKKTYNIQKTAKVWNQE